MKNKKTTEYVNRAKRYMKVSFKEYKQTVLSRGNVEDVEFAESLDDLVDAVCNRGVYDADGRLIAVQYKKSKGN